MPISISRDTPPTSLAEPAPQRSHLACFEWVLLGIVLLIVLFVRWRLLELPLERDEGEYAYGGQLLRGAGVLYRDLHSMKWPGIYGAYALLISVLGETTQSIRMGLLFINLASAAGLYLLAKEFLGRNAAAFATAAYLVLTLLPVTHGIMANAEHFALLWSIWGWWILTRSLRSHSLPGLLLAGACLAIGTTMKQHAMTFVACGGLLILLDSWASKRNGSQWKQVIQKGLTYSCGALLIWAIMLGLVWNQGIWNEFVLWTIVYPRGYTSQVSLASAPYFFEHGFTPIFRVTWPLFLLAAVGFVSLLNKQRLKVTLSTFSFLAAGLLATVPGYYFRTHYFLFAMPEVALFAGFGMQRIAGITRLPQRTGSLKAGIVAFLSLAIPIALQGALLFWKSPSEVSREMYGGNPFVETPRIAAYLKEQMQAADRMVIFGSEPQICFEAQRRLAGGFVYMYPMMELHPLASEMQRRMIREVESDRPEFAVFVHVRTSWLERAESDRTLIHWMQKYLEQEFVPCGLVILQSLPETRFEFASPGETLNLKQFPLAEDSSYITVFRRPLLKGRCRSLSGKKPRKSSRGAEEFATDMR